MHLAQLRSLPQKQHTAAASRPPVHATTGRPVLGRRQLLVFCCCVSMLLRRHTPANSHRHRSFGLGALFRQKAWSGLPWNSDGSAVTPCFFKAHARRTTREIVPPQAAQAVGAEARDEARVRGYPAGTCCP